LIKNPDCSSGFFYSPLSREYKSEIAASFAWTAVV